MSRKRYFVLVLIFLVKDNSIDLVGSNMYAKIWLNLALSSQRSKIVIKRIGSANSLVNLNRR